MYNAARERIPSGSPQPEAGPSETLLIRYVNHKSFDCKDRCFHQCSVDRYETTVPDNNFHRLFSSAPRIDEEPMNATEIILIRD